MEKKFSDLFAFDLDGTLVHSDPLTGERQVPAELLKKVFDISLRAHVMVATGRRYRAALPDIQVLPSLAYVVVHNGLVIRDATGKLVERAILEIDEALQITKALAEFRDDYFFVCDGYESHIDYLYFEKALQNSSLLRRVEDRAADHRKLLQSEEEFRLLFSKPHSGPLLEVALLGDYPELLQIREAIRKKMSPTFNTIVVKNIGHRGLSVLEIFKKPYSKWWGVDWVKKKLGATRVIAIGDDENDLEMIESADVGVAMKHAEPHILKVSKVQTDGPQGLAKFLEEFYSQ
ncbi:MAG: HAD-IIB family hydrolase [Deltaproteobacteria bacterium]|nr:HAD-IIB family hydrolase [Deltaproteobacteria bacterium]